MRLVYHTFKEFCTVEIGYGMFENVGDTYYRFYNNIDMYTSDSKN